MIPTRSPLRKPSNGPMDRWKPEYHVEREFSAPDDEPIGEIIPCEKGIIWVDTVDPPVLGLTLDRKSDFADKTMNRLVKIGVIEVLDGFSALIKKDEMMGEVFAAMGAYTHVEAKDEYDING